MPASKIEVSFILDHYDGLLDHEIGEAVIAALEGLTVIELTHLHDAAVIDEVETVQVKGVVA
jgi:hypothetical protein